MAHTEGNQLDMDQEQAGVIALKRVLIDNTVRLYFFTNNRHSI